MPTVFSVFGLRFYFYSREHEPIHIHVEGHGGKAKFELLDDEVVLKFNDKLKINDIHLAESIIEENKSLIAEKWRDFFEQ